MKQDIHIRMLAVSSHALCGHASKSVFYDHCVSVALYMSWSKSTKKPLLVNVLDPGFERWCPCCEAVLKATRTNP